ncbi:hypothetical protein FRIG_03775 [Frigoribacterium faeni]|uniref:hypothetical protein n=1 Tax=Frigoribacterium faeni TaxID=145483 RepID=UPI001FAE0818|nr:hypothetical protein [Frigoribacterium faeni]MCJ0700260.1 hypothetical protein [Frigoribacterium faeni]
MSDTSAPRAKHVTLDLMDDDVYDILVNALRQAAAVATASAERAGDDDAEPDADYADSQEQAAQIALDLIQSIETQTNAVDEGDSA